MPDPQPDTDPFLRELSATIDRHLGEEAFGVAELAEEMNMSRSTLLRRVKQATGRSAAVFIRHHRLTCGKSLLQTSSLTVSEVAFQVGFSSSSYFAKCFREEFGYPPGEAAKHPVADQTSTSPDPVPNTPSQGWLFRPPLRWGLGLTLLTFIGLWLFWLKPSPEAVSPKTIAVLPFQNDSEDSSNVYLINGLMVAIIDHLHQVEHVQVTSRTTVERYRGVSRTIPELAEALNVRYFVEGSGQKMGDQILLTLRLIDAQADTLIWSRRFQRETDDIFQLQAELSTSIVEEIEVVLSPAEQERLRQPPTDNLAAYDLYLQGLELIKAETREGLLAGIGCFQRAIAEDPQFAHPYAYLAISYYFLDLFQVEQSHIDDINTYADQALLLDPTLNESLIGKALYYMQSGQYSLAIQFFHKVLARSPGSGWTHNLLSTIYNLYLPNTEQYLRHAIQGLPFAIAGQDSPTVSVAYLHLGNALAQNGFLAEAEPYLENSLRYQPENRFAELLAIYVQLGQTDDLDLAYERLQTLLAKDTTFLAVLQEVAKIAYYRGDYAAAWQYYHQFLTMKEAANLNIYPGEDIKIAHVLELLGRSEEAAHYQQQYFDYLQGEESIYRDLGMAVYYAATNDRQAAMAALEAFAELDGYQYWFVMFIDDDPLLQRLADEPAYPEIIARIRAKFWSQHREMRAVLEAEGVI